MRICAYVQASYAKSAYKNECMDQRQFAGLRVIIDCLARAGYAVEYATRATVHEYDVALVSITSDCDWWPFIQERLAWQRSDCKVLVGGAGVLHVEPFLPWFYAAMLGRGENLIVPLVQAIARGDRYQHESILYADEFSRERVWRLAQVEHPYCHIVHLSDDNRFFDMDKLFGAFTPQTLPSRYLRTYANIEKMWGKTPLELAARKGGDAT